MMSIEQLYQHYLKFRVISTDTRKISKGCLFFALKGDNFNANEFAAQAIKDGAEYAIIDDVNYAYNEKFILVNDVLETLQKLAAHHRKQLNIQVIGLTGSNGKTTSKELVNAVLKEQFNTYATRGNLNNHIGVPLSILEIDPTIEIAIIEMGANHQGEIDLLCSIAQPTYGIISNVGLAHLEGFGGFEGVKKGKAELYKALKSNRGLAFINIDNTDLMQMAKESGLTNLVYYSTKNTEYTYAKLISNNPFISIAWIKNEEERLIKTHLTGTYNFENLLAAICIGDYFKLSSNLIIKGLENYLPKNNRSQLEKTENNHVICDYYNANPSSLTVAIQNLNSLEAETKVAILGDMFELGAQAEHQHLSIAQLATSQNFQQVILIGENFFKHKEKVNALFFETINDAELHLTKHNIKESLVLLKGSRGMKLEKLFQYL